LTEARTVTVSAELKFLADLSQPLVYVPSKGGGELTALIKALTGARRVEVFDDAPARESLESRCLVFF
jgi:hypothetical protein